MLSHYRFIISLVFCSLCVNAFGQEAAIQVGPNNELYVGESTPIDIIISENKRQKVVVDVSGNLKYNQSDSSLIGLRKGVGVIRVGTVKKQDTLWVDSLHVIVKALPSMRAKFGTLESVRNVPKTALAIQKTIRIDCSLPRELINQDWKVTSFRVSVLNTNTTKTFECQGFHIPEHVSNYISNHATEYVVVDRIIAVNTKSLVELIVRPIHIEIQTNEIRNEKRLIQGNYKDKRNQYKQFDLVTEDPFIDTAFLDVDSGSIKTFGSDYQFERLYFNGIVVEKSHFDQYGRLDYQMKRIRENNWTFEKYDTFGVIVLETTINDTLQFYGSKSVDLFLHNPFFGLPDYSSLEHDIVSFYKRYHNTPIDSFITRYDNGLPRLVGNLKLRVGTHETWDTPRCGNIGLDEIPNDMSVLDGKWVFYDEKGAIIEETEYTFGETQED